MDENIKRIAKKQLKKTEVDLRTSEYKLSEIIYDFTNRCEYDNGKCENCKIIKNVSCLADKNLCLSRYIYEKTVNYHK